MRARCNCKCYAYAACNKRIRYTRSHAFSLAPNGEDCMWMSWKKSIKMHSSAFSAEFSCRSRWFLCRRCCCCCCCCAAENKQKAKLLPLSWPGLLWLSALLCSALPLLNLRHCAANFNSVICAVSLSQVVCVLCALSHCHLDQQPTISQQPNIRNPKTKNQIRHPNSIVLQSQPLPTSHISQSKRNKRRPVNTTKCINYLTSCCLPRTPPLPLHRTGPPNSGKW